MNRFLLAGILTLCTGLLWIDGQNFCLPVAFMLCIVGLWKKGKKAIFDLVHTYQKTLKDEFSDAQETLLNAKKACSVAETSNSELPKRLDAILQMAHQEAAFILKKNEHELDAMQEGQRRQMEIQTTVSRQQWKSAMGEQLIEATKTYIQEHPRILPISSNTIGTMANKINRAIHGGDPEPR
jgi:F0F1-type ATP synthase membrane subunit b/b'